jgi:hypothetical protein
VPLPRPSRRKRKREPRQPATFERATCVAAAADLKPVSARSQPAAPRHTLCLSTNSSTWFDSPVSGRVDLGPCLPKHVTSELLCFLICDRLPCRSTVKRVAPNPFRRSIHARVTPACPHSTSARIRTPRQLSMQANLIPSPLELRSACNVQHAACNLHLANLQRATRKNATFKMQQTWLQPCNIQLVVCPLRP